MSENPEWNSTGPMHSWAVIKHKGRQPGYLRLCNLMLSPHQQRRPSIINPTLSSQSSSHNMPSHVTLTFFTALFSLPSTHHPHLSFPAWGLQQEGVEGKDFDLPCFLHSVDLKGFRQRMIHKAEGEKHASHLRLLRFVCDLFPVSEGRLSYLAVG